MVATLALPNPSKYCKSTSAWTKAVMQLHIFIDGQQGEDTVRHFAQCTKNLSKRHIVQVHMGNAGNSEQFGCLTIYNWRCNTCKPCPESYWVEALDEEVTHELVKLYNWFLRQCLGNHDSRIATLCACFPDAMTPSCYQHLLRIHAPTTTDLQCHVSADGKAKQKATVHPPIKTKPVLLAVQTALQKCKALNDLLMPPAKHSQKIASSATSVINLSAASDDKAPFELSSDTNKTDFGFTMLSPFIAKSKSISCKASTAQSSSPIPFPFPSSS
ncbi:hypothetical protein Moror_5643 [Moniliophthora roreri MCA 2997]|uniref:Uncharacterized protein n=2 Tax=Moniliophthora roreri TaxID=221103 RepID=V2XTM7_MONRO|nr:hypothetical protein Moror_5643 [Moniliophthora roreri MCA 2997]